MSAIIIPKTFRLWFGFFAMTLLLFPPLEMHDDVSAGMLPIKDSSKATVEVLPDPNTQPPVIVVNPSLQRSTEREDDSSALMQAFTRGDIATVQDLLAKQHVNAKTLEVVFMLAALQGHHAMLEVLSAKGVSPNILDSSGVPILHTAVAMGRTDAVRTLLNLGADPNAKSRSGGTALYAAVFSGRNDVVEILLDKGAIIDRGNDKDVPPLLVLAAEKGYETIVRELLKNGADVNAKISVSSAAWYVGDTALIRATTNGHAGIVQALIEKGADVNAKNNIGWTALFIAAGRGHESIVRLLLDGGADLSARDTGGLSVLDAASLAGHVAIERMLFAQEAAGQAEKSQADAASLVYFQEDKGACNLKQWSPITQSSIVLLSVPQCTSHVVLNDSGDKLLLVAGKMLHEVVLRPTPSLSLSVQRPFEVSVKADGSLTHIFRRATYLKDGRLAIEYERQTAHQGDAKPGNPTTRSLYVLEHTTWVLIEEKSCEDEETCFATPTGGILWSERGKDSAVWSPMLRRNPYVVSKGLAGWNDSTFILDKRVEDVPHKEPQPQWKYVKFNVKGKESVLIYNIEEGLGSAVLTERIFLQTSKNRKPIKLADESNDTVIEGKFLLIIEYSRQGSRLIDLETGRQLLNGLQAAFWVR